MAGPAQAECLGGGCYDGLLTALIAIVVYALVAIVLLILQARRKWRRFGLRALAVVLAIAVGVPLVSQAWQRLVLWRVESREVVGAPPPLELREPLVIAQSWACRDDACAALLAARGARGVVVLPVEALERLDLSRPLVLAALPLELWREGASGGAIQRGLTLAERDAILPRLDYLVLTTEPYYRADPGAIEAALQSHPTLRGLDGAVLVRLGMAPLTPGAPHLDFAALNFDLLDLSLITEALGLPLIPGHWQRLQNESAGVAEAVKSICPDRGGEVDWFCRDQIER